MLPCHPLPCPRLSWHPPPRASTGVVPQSSSLWVRAQPRVMGDSAPDPVPTHGHPSDALPQGLGLGRVGDRWGRTGAGSCCLWSTSLTRVTCALQRPTSCTSKEIFSSPSRPWHVRLGGVLGNRAGYRARAPERQAVQLQPASSSSPSIEQAGGNRSPGAHSPVPPDPCWCSPSQPRRPAALCPQTRAGAAPRSPGARVLPQAQHQEGPAAPARQVGQLHINGAAPVAPVPGTFLPCIIITLKTMAWRRVLAQPGLWQT